MPEVPPWLLKRMKPRAAERFELPAKVDEGKRNDTLYRSGRSIRARGLNEPEILAALTAANGKRCDPPLPAGEVAQIAHSAATEPNRPDFGQMCTVRTSDAGAVRAEGDSAGELPIINRYNRPLREQVSDGIAALIKRNQRQAEVFDRSGALARIKIIEGAAEIEMFVTDSLTHVLTRPQTGLKTTARNIGRSNRASV